MVSPLPSIVTLAQAKKAARIDPSNFEEDSDLYLRLEIAHEAVLDYVNNRVEDTDDEWLETILTWNSSNAPRQVKAAILAMFVYLTRFRGDDNAKELPELPDGDLPPNVRMYLKRLRDPTVA